MKELKNNTKKKFHLIAMMKKSFLRAKEKQISLTAILHNLLHLKYISTTQFYVGVKVHQCNFGSSHDGLDPKLVYVVNDEEGAASSTSEERTMIVWKSQISVDQDPRLTLSICRHKMMTTTTLRRR